MRLVARVSRVIDFLRGGGVPAAPHVSLLALLPRRVSDDQITAVACELIMHGRRPIDAVDVGAEIIRVTDKMPLRDDIQRVRRRLAEIGLTGTG
jgi:Protein of unknown function (DUF3349)